MVTLLVAKIVQIVHKTSQKSEFTCFSAFAYMQLAVKNSTAGLAMSQPRRGYKLRFTLFSVHHLHSLAAGHHHIAATARQSHTACGAAAQHAARGSVHREAVGTRHSEHTAAHTHTCSCGLNAVHASGHNGFNKLKPAPLGIGLVGIDAGRGAQAGGTCLGQRHRTRRH